MTLIESNPWNFESFEDFRFYCCPECDTKTKESEEFKDHALQYHAKSIAHIFLSNLTGQAVKQNVEKVKPEINEDIDDLLDESDEQENSDEDLETETFHCELCNELFSEERTFSEHFDIVHKVTKPEVNESKKRKRARENEEKIQCDLCQSINRTAILTGKDSFQRHLRTIHQVRRSFRQNQDFQCDLCDKGYKSEEGLQRHKKVSHQIVNPQGLKCYLCEIDFISQEELNNHSEAIHKVEGGYKCDICDDVRSQRQGFQYHVRFSHFETRKNPLKKDNSSGYKCDFCDKVFDSYSKKDYHKRKFHVESSTTCDLCGKMVSSSSDLFVHKRRDHHSYEIPEEQKVKKCDHCDTEFRASQDFDEHLKSVHNCDKDFKCNECDTTWVSHLSLELHYIDCHKKLMFSCDICGYTTTQLIKLPL